VKDPFGNEQHDRGRADQPGTRGYEFPAMENQEISEIDQSIAKRRSVCRALRSHVTACAGLNEPGSRLSHGGVKRFLHLFAVLKGVVSSHLPEVALDLKAHLGRVRKASLE
jgi:hypothetical protein